MATKARLIDARLTGGTPAKARLIDVSLIGVATGQAYWWDGTTLHPAVLHWWDGTTLHDAG